MSELEEYNTLRNSIIKNVLKDIYKNYTVRNSLDKYVLQDYLFNELTNKNRCKSMNNKMIQCKNNIVNKSDFCEKHYVNKFSQNKENYIETESYQEIDSDTEYIWSLDKKLIKDSFYYIDNKYNCFYDSDFNRVGIIQDSEYIFSTNPFLFEQW